MNNFWSPYPYNHAYQIYQNGDVKHNLKQVKKTPQIDKDGYLVVNLYEGGKYKTKKIHRLVAETFIPNPQKKPEVNHIDGDKTNNWYWNLEWVTTKENHLHAYKIGLRNDNHFKGMTHSRGMGNPKAKLNDTSVRMILKQLNKGFTTKQVAVQFGVSQSTIQRIRSGKLWKHLQ